MQSRQTSENALQNTALHEIKERCVLLAEYIVETGATVRGAASKFGVSKSTVHNDITVKLPHYNRALYLQVRRVLEHNKEERHIRGGIATKKKYALLRQKGGIYRFSRTKSGKM